jgi:DivIVA domain-containing protein
MSVTPEDVRNKRFTPVRLREGYNMREVDQFLDQVEAELARLRGEPDQLGSAGDVTPARDPAALPGPRSSSRSGPSPDAEMSDAPRPGTGVASDDPLDLTALGPPSEPAPLTVSAAAGAAARLLEIAGRSADELVADAKAQAELILADARAEADRREAEAARRADQLESDARATADEIDSDVSARRSLLLGELERDRARLAQDVEELRTFERECRAGLRTYLATQLAQLNGAEPAAEPAPMPVPGQRPAEEGATPAGLASLLRE